MQKKKDKQTFYITKDNEDDTKEIIYIEYNLLDGYKITPKGMLQIFLKQDIPTDILKKIFAETLG